MCGRIAAASLAASRTSRFRWAGAPVLKDKDIAAQEYSEDDLNTNKTLYYFTYYVKD